MNSRQRLLAALSGDQMDKIPITELGVWPETHARWIKEGMPVDITVENYFGLDKIEVFPFDGSLRLPSKTIEDTEKYIVFTDSNGCTFKRLKNSYGASSFINAAVSDSDSWQKLSKNLKPELNRFEGDDYHFGFGHKLPTLKQERYKKSKKDDIFTVYSPTEPCWFYLNLLGEEEALCNIAINPDFAEQIFDDYTKFNMEMMDIIYSAGYRFDALWVFSDLCYKNGMLFSPAFFRERLLPYLTCFFQKAKELGMKIIYHSDGYVGELIPLLIEAGVDCMQPLEVRAGNDVRDYIHDYPGKMSYMGNINADVLASDKEAIYNEIKDKVSAAKATGRYIYHSDHSIPDTVSLENFKYAQELANKFGGY